MNMPTRNQGERLEKWQARVQEWAMAEKSKRAKVEMRRVFAAVDSAHRVSAVKTEVATTRQRALDRRSLHELAETNTALRQLLRGI